MVEKLSADLTAAFPDFKMETTKDDEKKTITIDAKQSMSKGFEVVISTEKKSAEVSFDTKLKMYLNIGGVVAAIALTFLFGTDILALFGMVADIGTKTVTLRILYIIPMLIFLIPSIIVFTIIGNLINPKDKELLAKVETIVKDNGFEIEAD